MAQRKIIVSDLNGEEVTEENGAKVTVSWHNREETRTLDVTAKEADELVGDAGIKGKKRGRKAADASAGNGGKAKK